MKNPFPVAAPQSLVSFTAPYADRVSLAALPYHIHEVLISAVSYHIIYALISPALSRRLFPQTYGGFDKRTRLNWNVHVVSLVQSILITALALWILVYDTERGSSDWKMRVYGYDAANALVVSLACGYFLWDFIMTALHMNVFGPGMMAHAIAALTAYGAGFRPLVTWYAPVFILFELSSPFLNFHWFFDKLGMTGSTAQLINGIILMSTFAGSRLVWGGYNCFSVFPDMFQAVNFQGTVSGREWFTEAEANVTTLAAAENALHSPVGGIDLEYVRRTMPKPSPVWYVGLYTISYSTLMILNFYWFGKMIETLRARFEPPIGTKGVKGKERGPKRYEEDRQSPEAEGKGSISIQTRKTLDGKGQTVVELEESKPTFAPKPSIDVKHIVQNSALYEQNCIERNYVNHAQSVSRIARLRDEIVRVEKDLKAPRAKFKQLQEQIRNFNEQGAETEDKTNADDEPMLKQARRKARQVKEELDTYSQKTKENYEEIEALSLSLPNLSSVHTPNGTQARILDVIENITPAKFATLGKSHVDIGAQLGILSFSQANICTGWGWYYLTAEGALLEQALVQYALSQLVKRGWQIVSPPSMVYTHVANACGFQPRDQNNEQQVYTIEHSQSDEENPEHVSQVLAGTSEIPLAALHAKSHFKDHELPCKTAAVSRCYRAEAGARGADTKGLYRVHEFTKVEMFAWTLPDKQGDDSSGTFDTSSSAISQSEEVFKEMLDIQRQTLNDLGLDFQILEMPSTDLGASASRKIDMEVYFPSRRDNRDGGCGEVFSTSNCTDYQTRRLATRYQQAGREKLGYPWTLNGTALAVPRILAALIECYWDEERQLMEVPDVLRPWMHGIDVIKARRTSPPLRAFA
ncbi:MAG: hypothetical protein Q9159_003151 [Coniocarpon cinnabarinum]